MPPTMARLAQPAVKQTAARLRRLAMLDPDVLEDVRTDAAATLPALLVGAGGVFALSLGGWLWWVVSGLPDATAVLLETVLLGGAFSLGGWLVWLIVIYVVLRQLSGVALQVDQLIRTAGFAAAPLVLALGMAIPSISFGVGLVALVAWAAATQAAVERTMGRGGGDVVGANLAGFAAWAVMMSLISSATNQIGPGPFLAESIWDALTYG
jgi:hypothetical protein